MHLWSKNMINANFAGLQSIAQSKIYSLTSPNIAMIYCGPAARRRQANGSTLLATDWRRSLPLILTETFRGIQSRKGRYGSLHEKDEPSPKARKVVHPNPFEFSKGFMILPPLNLNTKEQWPIQWQLAERECCADMTLVRINGVKRRCRPAEMLTLPKYMPLSTG